MSSIRVTGAQMVTDDSTPRRERADSERKRAYWRSRRGLLELDLLLPPFVLARFDTLTGPQRTQFERLLQCEDQDVWDWFQRRTVPPDPELEALIDLIRSFNGRTDRRV